ncbi:MAG: NADH-quinone oxidoreductase subunit L [candidate division WOR-3 bacterium]
MIGIYALISFLLPFLSFIIIGFFIRRYGKISAYLSITCVLLSLFFSILSLIHLNKNPGEYFIEWLWLSQKLFTFKFGIWVDPLSSAMLFVVALVASMVQIYSLGYMKDETPPSLGRYYAYHSLFTFSMMGLVLSKNILELFVFWELVGLCSYLLIGFWFYKPSAAKAAVKAFWTTRLGDVGFMLGLLYLYKHTGCFELKDLLSKAPEFSQGIITTGTLLLFCGAVGKSAQFPLHIWLPDAMEGPTPVSALIHAATMVAAGVYMVARLFPLFSLSKITLFIIAFIGAFTAVLASTMAIVQEDIKRVLAYSTISQLGYMMAGLGVGNVNAGFFHLFTHAYFKALLFLCAGCAIHAVHSNSIWDMGGLLKRMPVTGFSFLIGLLALSGIPPFSGFFSKEEIIHAAYLSEFKLPFYLLIIGVFLTAFYMARVFFVAFLGKERKEEAKHAHEAPYSMTIPLIILSIFSIFSGFYKNELYKFLGEHENHHSFSPALPLFSFLLAISGFFLAYLYYYSNRLSPEKTARKIYPVYNLVYQKYYMDHIAEWIYSKVALNLSFLAAWWDRHVVDGTVNWVTYTTGRLGKNLRVIQTGIVQDYLVYIAIAFIIIGFIVFQIF